MDAFVGPPGAFLYTARAPQSIILGAVRIVLTAVLVIAAYELLRHAAVTAAGERLRRRARKFAELHGIRVDLFKFGGKQLVREELFNDLVVQRAMLTAAQSGERAEDVRRRVEEYIDEIVPAFSLTAYYELGLKLAGAAVRAAYRPLVVRKACELPKDATAVFLINHRSNFDYVAVGWALAQRVAISYAVGEWARIFPLDALFKAFGGFFVRRGFPDPLYHTVLRRYLQLITRHGVTQGIFPEGGLTRDGALRAPKVGLLDALLQLVAEPGFDRELLFVPVGINYDRVLEDEALLAEKRGREHPPTRVEKIRGAVRLLWIVPLRIASNAVRAATGRLQRNGYAAVAFGEPIDVRKLLGERGLQAAHLSDEQRRALAKDVARELMDRIARCIPATPVPLVARAMLELRETSLARLAERVRDLREELAGLGVPTALGEEFEAQLRARESLGSGQRTREVERLEAEVLTLEEAEELARLGVELLARRRLLRASDTAVGIGPHPHAEELLEYYARSLAALSPLAAVSGAQVTIA
jgi:glycerol-3-phosphate O-acyltransferase